MTKYEQLLDAVSESEILYMRTKSDNIPAQSVRIDGDYGILFNESAFDTDAERLISLAHEKAHCDTGSLYSVEAPIYDRERYENRAWKRTIHDLLPFGKFKTVLQDCVYADGLDIYELADKVGVTAEFAIRAIEHYHNQGMRW